MSSWYREGSLAKLKYNRMQWNLLGKYARMSRSCIGVKSWAIVFKCINPVTLAIY
jgi:hypothetical protein